ncbi:MAG: DUF3179 domain-containing protein [Balneolaceae bacterium]|nr:DUF3179 domain-containing protein [Balneolaceae bacterium]
MYLKQTILLISCLPLVISCARSTSTDNDNEREPVESDWLIADHEVIDGGPGKDGIPSIDDPVFSPAHTVDYVQDERLIIGVKIGDEIKAYTHQVLDWHEVVNDHMGNFHYSLTYCPLTGTGIAWDRTIDGKVTEFGVSGLLYRNNLIAYDRNTETNWSQMQIRAVNGPLSGERLPTFHTVETTWETWKEMYPNSQVITTKTGYSRPYNDYAYGRLYLTNHDYTLFSIKHENDRLPNKTLVHAALIGGEVASDKADVRVYPINEMSDSIRVINETYSSKKLVAAGSASDHFTVSFYRTLDDGTILHFEPIQGGLPVIMKDQEGNSWNIFGEAVNGPRTGEKLNSTTSYNGYWFAIADFYPLACIHPQAECTDLIDK